MTGNSDRLRQLPLSKAAAIAWRGIRVRLGRSLLVTAGIILPIAFLMYILCSDSFAEMIRNSASRSLVYQLISQGKLVEMASADARIQTRWMVGLALLISFVGILNSMLMSVTERFREIGTMKCLGALDSFIIKLFLLESLFQGLVGTILGILAGAVLAVLEARQLYGGEFFSLLSPAMLLRMTIFCFLAGVALTVGGAVYPAIRAAHMKPVDAMRTEI
jgi:cell division protein FtsX